jgi:hypothetical protein
MLEDLVCQQNQQVSFRCAEMASQQSAKVHPCLNALLRVKAIVMASVYLRTRYTACSALISERTGGFGINLL